MQLTPRYGPTPIITLDGPPAAILDPTVRQRERLAERLSAFSEDEWAHPSRCAGWSNRDVVVHLDSTNSFWTFSIQAGLRDAPTEFLTTFDPVASPAALVAASADLTAADVLDRFRASTDTLCALLTSLEETDWLVMAEAPPGHLHVSSVAHHALWDSWIHERDILLPLGLDPAEEADEIAACLRYAASLGPAFAVSRDPNRRGTLAVIGTGPEVGATVEASDGAVHVRTGASETDARIAGPAVELLEALSIRQPLEHTVPESAAWMLHGLAETFDN